MSLMHGKTIWTNGFRKYRILKKIHFKEKNHRIRARLMSLILIKESKFKGQLEVAMHLWVDHATIKR